MFRTSEDQKKAEFQCGCCALFRSCEFCLQGHGNCPQFLEGSKEPSSARLLEIEFLTGNAINLRCVKCKAGMCVSAGSLPRSPEVYVCPACREKKVCSQCGSKGKQEA